MRSRHLAFCPTHSALQNARCRQCVRASWSEVPKHLTGRIGVLHQNRLSRQADNLRESRRCFFKPTQLSNRAGYPFSSFITHLLLHPSLRTSWRESLLTEGLWHTDFDIFIEGSSSWLQQRPSSFWYKGQNWIKRVLLASIVVRCVLYFLALKDAFLVPISSTYALRSATICEAMAGRVYRTTGGHFTAFEGWSAWAVRCAVRSSNVAHFERLSFLSDHILFLTLRTFNSRLFLRCGAVGWKVGKSWFWIYRESWLSFSFQLHWTMTSYL